MMNFFFRLLFTLIKHFHPNNFFYILYIAKAKAKASSASFYRVESEEVHAMA